VSETREVSNAAQKETAPPKEVFELLHDSLVKYHDGFVEGGYKVVGFLLLVLAWLLTSQSTQSLFSDSLEARAIASVALLIGVVLYVEVARRVKAVSHELYARLQELSYMRSDRYSDRRIDSKMLTSWVCAVSLLVLLEIALIWFVLSSGSGGTA